MLTRRSVLLGNEASVMMTAKMTKKANYTLQKATENLKFLRGQKYV
jgi:hypothetical protein